MAQKKETKIKNTLKRHEDSVDRDLGISLINDFLQLGHALERLKETDPKSYSAMYCLIEENLKLKEDLKA
jgi:hypothetical protein